MEVVQTFSNMRSINLSNFLNNIILEIIHDKLNGLLPRIISQNQFDFIKVKSIKENALLG